MANLFSHPSLRIFHLFLGSLLVLVAMQEFIFGQTSPLPPYRLVKRTTVQQGDNWSREESQAFWDPQRTAVIVCDVWDYHHCINAVRRMEEFLPQIESLLKKTRAAGSIIIHSPSDCMPHYENHPARLRALEIPKSSLPTDIGSWNCKINREAIATYPIDQSDGGEDDDPQEHKQWSEQLAKLGRNPNLPWKSQNPALTIDSSKDYISDRGDEVWSVLKKHQIDHVLMVGVHTNMCVLGRPFGLRQLVQNGLDVVLIRDLTDCMYNPNRWPYVDHYSGNDLLISYVEQTVCPTITSNQILGGKPIAFSKDKRESRDLLPSQIWGAHQEKQSSKPPEWELIEWDRILTVSDAKQTQQPLVRCSVRIPTQAFADSVTVSHPRIVKAWLNGHPLPPAISPNSANRFEILSSHTFGNDDANVLVLQLDTTGRTANAEGNPKPNQSLSLNPLPTIQRGSNSLPLGPTWQRKATWQDSDCNLPLPAKFALPPAIYYTLSLP